MARQNQAGLRIRRAKVDSLCIYEVTEEELDELEKGSPDSLYLLFSIFFLTEATAFLIVLLTISISATSKSFTIFVLLTIIGFALGIVLLLLWLKGYVSSTSVVKKIRQRLDEETPLIVTNPSDPTSIILASRDHVQIEAQTQKDYADTSTGK